MAWLAVNKNGTEVIFSDYPERASKDKGFYWDCVWVYENCPQVDWGVEIPKDSIKKLIGRELTWNDEPVEI